ncbi:MAG: acyltransferase family protein [Thermosynechococcaceae cyanobacterium]
MKSDKLQIKYRGDIDGLRAIAVLAVIVFHYVPSLAPGGYVGVDVFFVISGYLITGILHTQMKSGTFNLFTFYERRIRRICPAMFAVLAFCGVCSLALNLPSETSTIGQYIAASILFISNVLFSNSSGYFDQNMELNSLLHTLSLSVEGQFYIFFPLLLLAMRSLGYSTKVGLLGGIAFVSFAYSVWMVQVDPNAAFYLVQFRAWELLIGSLLAIGAVPAIQHRGYAEGLGIAGLAMILASVMWLSPETAFPGAAALLPCLGTAAILHSGAGASTRLGSLLSKNPMSFLGQVSYSLYLWHWPLWVFYQLLGLRSNYWNPLGLIGAFGLMTYLSWRFIETPFRNHAKSRGVRQTGVISCAMVVPGVTIALQLGSVSALFWNDLALARAERILAYTSYDADKSMRKGTCFITQSSEHYNKDKCLEMKPDQKNFLLLGDSHAAHLWAGLIVKHPDINFLQATASGCKPVLNTKGKTHCTDLIEFILNDFLPHHRLDGIILSGRWVESDVRSVKPTVELLHTYADQIAVFGPIVEYEQSLPRILSKAVQTNEQSFASKYRKPDQLKTDRLLATDLRGEDVKYFSVYRALCSTQCVVRTDGKVPLQFDYGHLTREGSVFVISKFDTQLFTQPTLSVNLKGVKHSTVDGETQ